MTHRVRGRGSPWVVGALAGLLMWVLGPSALAQTSSNPEGPAVEQRKRELEQERYRRAFTDQVNREMERARRQVETLYFLRLSETVGLNTEQSAQAILVIRKAQEARRSLAEERRQLLEELNALAAAGAGADQIRPKVAQWERNEARLARWRRGLFQELSRILSVEQQARYLLFEENFNTEVRNAVLELRSGGSQRAKE